MFIVPYVLNTSIIKWLKNLLYAHEVFIFLNTDISKYSMNRSATGDFTRYRGAGSHDHVPWIRYNGEMNGSTIMFSADIVR